MRHEHDGWKLVLAAALGAVALLIVLVVGGRPAARAAETPPAPPGAAPAAGQEPPAQPAAAAEAPPRIIRVVCTDRICGHCDGKCHKNSGHVAVDKKGHCACTPTEGSALDRATRDAYEKNPPQ